MDVVQDAYSLRCSPQIHGPIYESVWELERALDGLCNKVQSKWVEGGANGCAIWGSGRSGRR